MNGKHILPAFALMISIFAYFSCDQASNVETQYISSIQGTVYDSSTHTPIEYVKNWATDITDTVYSNALGIFKFQNIHMPRSEKTYTIITTKQGYDTVRSSINAKSDETKYLDTIYLTLIP